MANPPTIEAVVDPELEIIDPHLHLFPIRHSRPADPPYLLADLIADLSSGHNIVGAVFVECGYAWRTDGPDHLAPLGEVEAVAAHADECARRGAPAIQGIVAHADLRLGPAVGSVLDQQLDTGRGLVRGVRFGLAWDDDPVLATSPGYYRSLLTGSVLGHSNFRAGIAELASRGLVFDAWIHHSQLAEFRDLAHRFPDTVFVLDHLAMPVRRGHYVHHYDEALAHWKSELTALQPCANVYLKLGGLGTNLVSGGTLGATPEASDALAAKWGPSIRWCIELFGADRCMFESNFPPDRDAGSYVAVWNAFKQVAEDASVFDRARLFSETARAVYRLPMGTESSGSSGGDTARARTADRPNVT